MVLAQKTGPQINETGIKPRNKSMYLWNKEGKNIQWTKTDFSLSGVGKMRQLYLKE